MILRFSHKFGSKIKVGSLKPSPLDANPYADWSCHLFTADRTQYILVSNTTALYSCVLCEVQALLNRRMADGTHGVS